MNARKKIRNNVLQRRAYLSGSLLDSIKRNGAGTLGDFVARFPDYTRDETERALEYLQEVKLVHRVSKEEGTLWVLERKVEEMTRPKTDGPRLNRINELRGAFPEFVEKAAYLIDRAESRSDRDARQAEIMAKFNWSPYSIRASSVRREAALRCLLHFGAKWNDVNDVAEKLGGDAHGWLSPLRNLVSDGIASMRYETKNGRHTCLYRRSDLEDANGAETPRAWKRDLILDVVSDEWQDVYAMAEKAGTSEQYARLIVKGLEAEGRVEARRWAGCPYQWRWKKEALK